MANTVTIKLAIQLRGLAGVEKLNTALEGLLKNTGGLGRGLRGSNAAWDKLSGTLNNAAKATQNINRAQTAQSRVMNNVQSARRRLTDAEKSALRESMRQQADIRRRADLYKTLGGRLRMFEQDVDSLFRAGYRLQMLGSDLQNIGKQVIGMLTGFSDAFGEFEFMALRAGGALQTPTEEMGHLEQSILDAARSLRLFDPTEVAEATYYWASTTGQAARTQEEMNALMEQVSPIMKAAAMTNTDYETAIKGVFSILTQYGKGLDQTADVTEKLFKATNVTAAEFPDLINSFKMVGPIAKENNITFEAMVEQFGRLADVGIRGTSVGRAFRQLFIQLARPAPKATDALNDLWASVEQFGGKSYTSMVFPQGEFVGITKYVNLLAEALKDSTDKERQFVLGTITTANELPVMTALVYNQINALKGLGKAWDAQKYSVTDASAYFEQAWSKLSGSWKGLTSAITNGVEIIRIQIGGRLAQVVRPVLEDFRRLLDRVSEWLNDPANANIIDFFIKLAAAIGGLALGAGILASLAGGLIAAGAAASLLWRSFKPLFGIMGTASAVIVAFATAIIDNMDYIVESVNKVRDNLSDAFRDSGLAADSLARAFGDLMRTVGPVFGFIVRTVADLVVVLSSLIKAVSQNEVAMQAFAVIVRALTLVFAAKMISGVLGSAKALLVLAGAFRALKTLMLTVSLQAIRFANVWASTPGILNKVKAAVGGVAGSIKGGLRGALSGNWIGIAVVGLTTLYEIFPPFKEAVDNAALGLRNFRKEAQDAFGAGPGDIEIMNWLDEQIGKSINDQGMWAKYEDDWQHHIRDILGGTFYFDERGFVGGETIGKMFDRWKAQGLTEIADFAEKAGVAVSDYGRMIQSTMRTTGVDLTKGLGAVDAYFTTVNGGAKGGMRDLKGFESVLREWGYSQEFISVNAARLWDSYAAATNASIESVEDTFNSQKFVMPALDQAAMGQLQTAQSMLNIPNMQSVGSQIVSNLVRDRGKYGPEINKALDALINDMATQGVSLLDDAGEEIVAEAAKIPGDIASALLEESKKLMDFPSQIAKIMKEAFKPNRQARSVFKDFIKGVVGHGFRDDDGHYHAEAALFAEQTMTDLSEQFKTYSENMPPADFHSYVIKTIRGVKKDIKDGFPKDVPDDMRQQAENFMTELYGYLGKPVPQSVLDDIWGTSKNAGQHTGKGFTAGIDSQKANAEAHAADVKNDAAGALKPTGVTKTHGKNTISKFGEGLRDGKSKSDRVINSVNEKTKTINKYTGFSYGWGNHLVSNFASGMKDNKYKVAEQVGSIDAYIAANLGHTTPKEGPLKDDDKWGGHFVDNLVRGMQSGIPDLVKTTSRVADAMTISENEFLMQNQGVTMESSSNREIDVNIKVTSPDGSVDRVKASQIATALSTSDLVLSLEHMATVG